MDKIRYEGFEDSDAEHLQSSSKSYITYNIQRIWWKRKLHSGMCREIFDMYKVKNALLKSM